jgi:hypothetical protein
MVATAKAEPDRRLWWTRFAAVLWFLAGIAFLLSVPIVLQISLWIIVGIVIVAALLAGAAAFLLARLKGGEVRGRWIKGTIALVAILTATAAFPVYYAATLTQLSPAMVPQAVLSNGQKTIVFQGMQHVGTEVFFKTVVYDLEDALSRGSVAYYEGVKPSNPADDVWFDQTITGGADLSKAYRELGEVCGLHFQSDYFGLVGRDAKEHPAAHVVADVDTAQLRAEYKRLMTTDPAFAKAMREREAQPAEDKTGGLERIVNFLRSGSPEQKETGAVLCRGYMTYASQRSPAGEMDKLILNYRNRVLADALLAEPGRRIYVTYGAAHLPGVLALLQKADPRWKIQTVKWSRTIDYQENLSGKL